MTMCSNFESTLQYWLIEVLITIIIWNGEILKKFRICRQYIIACIQYACDNFGKNIFQPHKKNLSLGNT